MSGNKYTYMSQALYVLGMFRGEVAPGLNPTGVIEVNVFVRAYYFHVKTV